MVKNCSFFCMHFIANICTLPYLFFKGTLFYFTQQPIIMISAKKSLGATYFWFCSSRVMKKNIFDFQFLCQFWAKCVCKYGEIMEIMAWTYSWGCAEKNDILLVDCKPLKLFVRGKSKILQKMSKMGKECWGLSPVLKYLYLVTVQHWFHPTGDDRHRCV